jgi:hypothetical protein
MLESDTWIPMIDLGAGLRLEQDSNIKRAALGEESRWCLADHHLAIAQRPHLNEFFSN